MWKNTASLLPLIHKQAYDDAHNKLTMLKAKLVALASRQFEETQEQRLWLNRTLTLYYPPQRTSMLPTRLGNVLKAAEMYTTERYHLDAVLIWSRLQPLLPKEFTDGLQDAEISLNIMVILSSACLFFGIPLSLLVGFKWDISLFWWLPLILTLLALLLQAYPVLVFALLALFLDGIVSISSHTPLLVGHIADIFFLSACSVLFSWVSYQNAVQSALAYGEQVKVAFDLYRWKVLDELHLQLPVDYSNEQKIWDEVCALLARSYQPDATVYRYRQPEQTNTSSPSP